MGGLWFMETQRSGHLQKGHEHVSHEETQTAFSGMEGKTFLCSRRIWQREP